MFEECNTLAFHESNITIIPLRKASLGIWNENTCDKVQGVEIYTHMYIKVSVVYTANFEGYT